MTAPSALDAAILTAILAWPARTEKGHVDFAALGKPGPEFKAHLAGSQPQLRFTLSDTELQAAWAGLARDAPDYRDWWRVLLRRADLKIDFTDREPILDVDSLEAWERLMDHLDGDALVTRALCELRPGSDIAEDVRTLDNWTTVVKASDRELEQLWRRGLSDLHIHVGGVRFAQAAWFNLIDGVSSPAEFRALDAELVPAIASARAARARLWTTMGTQAPPEDAPLADDGEGWWTWDRRRLIGERVLLGLCWQHDGESSFVRDLDHYLSVKSRFLHGARQPYDTAPGLDTFKQYFDQIKGGGAKGLSPRLSMQAFGDALAFLGESRALRRAELRFAPPASPADMGRSAAYFGELVTRYNSARRGAAAAEGEAGDTLAAPVEPPKLDARMAFHLKRSRGKRGDDATLSKLLREMDRDSASLRQALADDSLGRPLRTWLARLDIAGQERDTSIIECVPYIRLAMGDEGPLAELAELAAEDPRREEFAHWSALADRGQHRPSLRERRLGLTIHSGEDYADPLSGLHEIASAVEFVGLRPGDGIGHGLAMTADMAGFLDARGKHAMISRRSNLDSLVWLSELMDKEGFPAAHAIQHRLRICVEEQAQQIFERPLQIQELAWLRRARAQVRTPADVKHDAARRALWAEHATEPVRKRFDELIPLPDVRLACAEAFAWAQQRVLDKVKRGRIVVELNPASNLRVSGASGAEMSATVDLLLESDDGLLCSINTDNPGIFLSRIENEYGLLLTGCRKRGEPEWRIRRLLERARSVGLETTYWPD